MFQGRRSPSYIGGVGSPRRCGLARCNELLCLRDDRLVRHRMEPIGDMIQDWRPSEIDEVKHFTRHWLDNSMAHGVEDTS